MSQVDIPPSAVDANSPVDEPLMEALDGNIDDLVTRVTVLENPGLRVFNHFGDDHGYPSGVIISGATPGSTNPITIGTTPSASNQEGPYADERFILYCGSSGSWAEKITGSTSDQHFLRATGGSAAHGIRCVVATYFDNRVKPITCIYRVKLQANPSSTTALFIGLLSTLGAAAARPTDGIYLEVVDATHWRFTSSRASSHTQGTQFTPPTAGTWFDIKIVFTDDPGNQALCYISDGATPPVYTLKDTLTLTLPTDKQVFANVSWIPSGNNFDLDSFDFSSLGMSNAA